MNFNFNHFRWYYSIIIFLFSVSVTTAQFEINNIGGFEQDLPAYWTKGAEPDGAALVWASDQARSMLRSLKITKSATSDAAVWESLNMCDNWSPNHPKDVDLKLGVYYMTQGVNTNPANDDEKWYVSYSFYKENGDLIGTTMLNIDQSSASTSGWVLDTNAVGATILPEDSYTTIIRFVGGKDATGTVWVDDFSYSSRGDWAGGIWNEILEYPSGWFYWLPRTDGMVSHGYENTIITDEEAHTGKYSLKFDLPFDRQVQDAFVGAVRKEFNTTVKPGDVLRVSVWIKAFDLVPDSAAKYPDGWSVGLTPLMFAGAGNNDGYDVTWGPDMHWKFPAVTEFDWTRYYEDIVVPEDGITNAMEVRLHTYNRFTGTIYFDDLKIEKLDLPEMSTIGSFEQELPSYWTKGAEPAGATLVWADDQAHSMVRSLKISKEATGEAAMWESENMCDNWSPTHPKDVDLKLGVYYKTEGVNTNPANDDEKWYVSYSFYKESGDLIGTTVIDLDQSTASTAGWVMDTNAVGATILPEDSYTTIIRFVGGKDATGTVWVDDFSYSSRGDWAGGIWNEVLEYPTGWFYWLPRTDGMVSHGYENTIVTDEEAHSGKYSLKFDLPFDRQVQDAFVGATRVALSESSGLAKNRHISSLSANPGDLMDIKPGDVLRLSVWIKAENLVPDSAAKYPDGWSVGLTPLMFASAGNNSGYDVTWGPDMHWKFPAVTQFDWTRYYEDIVVPEDGVTNALEIRLHTYNRFTGTIYFDDLLVEKLDLPEMEVIGGFEQDMPSYWNKGAEPAGASLEWASDEARSMVRSLKIDKEVTAEAAMWESENMCDNWSPTHPKDVDLKLGVYYKTMNVNTNPANDDEKWYVSYSFYKESGDLIGTTMIELDQSTASTTGWVLDTNAVGATILPEDSYTTIIRFVGGKDATGTVWVDDFSYSSRGDWAGGIWNEVLEYPTGWFYWLPRTDGMVSHGYENTIITDEEAHSGLHSLKFDLPFDRQVQDAFIGARRVTLSSDGALRQGTINALTSNNAEIMDAQPGDVLRISVWIKAFNLVPDSAAKYPDGWSVGLTPLMFAGAGNNDGYDVTWGPDMHWKFPAVTEFDWMEFWEDITVPEDGVTNALEVRLHTYNRFTGTVYFDDLTIKKIGLGDGATDVNENGITPYKFELSQNYPNPFNPSTTINFSIAEQNFVNIRIYDMLGREVATLMSRDLSAGSYTLVWNGKNSNGARVSTGTYIYRIEAGDFVDTKKMILLK